MSDEQEEIEEQEKEQGPKSEIQLDDSHDEDFADDEDDI